MKIHPNAIRSVAPPGLKKWNQLVTQGFTLGFFRGSLRELNAGV